MPRRVYILFGFVDNGCGILALFQMEEFCMNMMWMGGLTGGQSVQRGEISEMQQRTQSQERTIRELEHHVARLSLMNQALWELISARLGISEADLQARINEVDLRDGVQDGAITHGPLQCPQCGRISNSRHWKCLYCGLEFQKPAAE